MESRCRSRRRRAAGPEENGGQLQPKASQRSTYHTGAGNPPGKSRRALRRRDMGQAAGPALASPLGAARAAGGMEPDAVVHRQSRPPARGSPPHPSTRARARPGPARGDPEGTARGSGPCQATRQDPRRGTPTSWWRGRPWLIQPAELTRTLPGAPDPPGQARHQCQRLGGINHAVLVGPRLGPGLLVFTVPPRLPPHWCCAWTCPATATRQRDARCWPTCPCPCKPSGRSARSPSPLAAGGAARRSSSPRPRWSAWAGPRAAPRTPPLRHATSGRTTNDQAAVASGVVASGRPAACSSRPPVSIPPVGQSAMRRATAGRILDAWRAGQTVARIEATAAAATSTAMLAQGIGKPTPEAFSSSSFLNSR